MQLREFIKQKYEKVATLIRPNSKVLDIGCNKGTLIPFLPKVDYMGVDIDKEAISELKKKGIKAYHADLNKDQIKIKEKFDYIIILDLLEHIINPSLLIQNARKLLKEDGFFILSMPNDYHFLNKIRFLLNKELFPAFNPHGHLHIFPITSGKMFLEKNSLRIIKSINMPPTKPSFIPKSIKKALSNLFPNNFSRVVLYLAKNK